jgi:hypothetical protein
MQNFGLRERMKERQSGLDISGRMILRWILLVIRRADTGSTFLRITTNTGLV